MQYSWKQSSYAANKHTHTQKHLTYTVKSIMKSSRTTASAAQVAKTPATLSSRRLHSRVQSSSTGTNQSRGPTAPVRTQCRTVPSTDDTAKASFTMNYPLFIPWFRHHGLLFLALPKRIFASRCCLKIAAECNSPRSVTRPVLLHNVETIEVINFERVQLKRTNKKTGDD